MTIDIIELSEEELSAMSVIQQKLVRTAQKNKNELVRKNEAAKKEYKFLLVSTNAFSGSLYSQKCKEMDDELKEELDVIAEQLLYNLSVNDPVDKGEMGEGGGDESSGYVVDYSLSYLERYIIVRDYYLAIEDPHERMVLYAADSVAKDYLSSYYQTLYNYLATLS